MAIRLNRRHVLFATGLFMLMAYQNCAQDPADTSTDAQSSYQETLPFAYQTKLDTISFMSCSDITDSVEPRAYFTIRAGAYKSSITSGIGLTSDFLTATKYYSNTDRGIALGQSDRNLGTMLTLSVRSGNNYQSPFLISSAPTVGSDVDVFLPELDLPEIAGPLAATSTGQMMKYFPGSDQQRLVEASLRFYQAAGNITNLRSALESGGLLVAGFSSSSDEMDTTLRKPSDFDDTLSSTTNVAYGTGYQLSFGTGTNLSGASFTAGARRIVTGVMEKDLLTGATNTTAGWDCSARFMIVRPEDAAGKCNTGVDRYQTGNTTQQTQLDAIRRVLRVEDWFVDMTNRCVVAKHTGDYCYGSTLGTRTIDYTATSCPEDSVASSASDECPHYITVCIRN